MTIPAALQLLAYRPVREDHGGAVYSRSATAPAHPFLDGCWSPGATRGQPLKGVGRRRRYGHPRWPRGRQTGQDSPLDELSPAGFETSRRPLPAGERLGAARLPVVRLGAGLSDRLGARRRASAGTSTCAAPTASGSAAGSTPRRSSTASTRYSTRAPSSCSTISTCSPARTWRSRSTASSPRCAPTRSFPRTSRKQSPKAGRRRPLQFPAPARREERCRFAGRPFSSSRSARR